ncbi:sigma-70 region 4 domain-containing protein [Paenarthrobacter sp. A20]|uniref:sigma-70 region 4 domain-containing protein n=1 Tax=Paenarthrobacter sp. A20 TaxID=2817891 RepID=UPI0020A107ED|nr:sigma-70 region 4 domain-containing protein [Paenarthrobacter sp. A20]MCP1414377.1 hypothetical protein [Paenarthrobacter sp. A20]
MPTSNTNLNPAVHRMMVQQLKLQDSNYKEARQNRLNTASQAREVGFTHREIGDVLGVTEAAARAMIKRAKGDTDGTR